MKKTVIAMFICAVISTAYGTGFRTFTDAEGRTIEAKILSVDSAIREIELERKDGKRALEQIKLFSEEDQAYVRAWVDASRFLSDENLQISFNKQTGDSYKQGMTDDQRGEEGVEGEVISYEITLKNRSKKPIENLKIDYKYFVRATGKDIPEHTLKEVKVETYTVERIPAGERVTFNSAEIKIEQKFSKTAVYDTSGGGFQGYDYNKKSEDELKGIWLKVYGPTVGDEPSVRDVTEPADLDKDFKWGD